jgi:glycosyltransferase involved in cell wall biosynthesis
MGSSIVRRSASEIASTANCAKAQISATLPPCDVEQREVLVSVVMPCLNEARTLASCIRRAHVGCQSALAKRSVSSQCVSEKGGGEEGTSSEPASAPALTYEIIIADNGSTDGSPDIAVENGARVVRVEQKGYGAALLGGITAARGKYVVMGDSDCSYDFGEIPRFLYKLEEGYDLVMGNRFAGNIMPGAMPWHHRYIGNPILSGLGRLLYCTPCRDWHCGLRAFDLRVFRSLGLKSTGMEFASEIVIAFARRKSTIAELPTSLHPDGRDRPPHLRSFRDGVRHIKFILLSLLSPKVTDTKSILTNLCSHFAKVSLMSGAALLCLAGIGKIWSIGPLYLFGDILLSHYAGITLGVAEIVLGIVACMFASQRAIRAVMLAIYLGFLVTLGLKYLNGATYCNCLPGVESSLPTMFFLDTLIVAGVLLSFFINVKLTDMQIRGLRGLFAATAISAVVLSLNYSCQLLIWMAGG